MARPQGEGGSPFDIAQQSMMSVVFNAFGYKATWQPLSGGPLQTAVVGFKDPTQDQNAIKNTNYSLLNPSIEYKFEDFVGLEDSVRDTTHYETISVFFSKTGPPTLYDVRKVEAKYDGKTFIATLEIQD